MNASILILWALGTLVGAAWPAYNGVATWSDFETAAFWFGRMWENLSISIFVWNLLHWYGFFTLNKPKQYYQKWASFRSAVPLTIAFVLLRMPEEWFLNWETVLGCLCWAALIGAIGTAFVHGINTFGVYVWCAMHERELEERFEHQPAVKSERSIA